MDCDLNVEQLKDKKNILEILNSRAKMYPDQIAFQFLTYRKEERKEQSITYYELNRRAQNVAAYLKKENMEGKRAVLLFPDGIDFIIAFLGCLYAKVVAVPLYHFRTRRKAERLISIILDSEPSLFMTNSYHINRLEEFMNEVHEYNLPWVATDLLADDDDEFEFDQNDYERESLAYLQYTSGSTSIPKGVMITHENVMHNMDVIYWHYGANQKSVGVSWIPHYHDMGLVQTILHPIYIGYMQVLMQPADFIGKPYRFYKAISDFKGTIFLIPNFAFDYSIKTITDEQKKELDLSTVRIAGNGSEPIHFHTMERFYDFFKSCGLSKSAILPGYGLAEATLFVTSCRLREEDSSIISIDVDSKLLEKNQVKLVNSGTNTINCCSSGIAKEDVLIKIVDPNTWKECEEQSTGEIWISSKSVSPGYWNKSDTNEIIFNAYIQDKQEGPFLRTGDVGFIYQDNLYISGRLKDVLIIRGSNYYPNDIEYTTINTISFINDNSCVAFTINEDNTELLYIAAEITVEFDQTIDPDESFTLIRRGISEIYGLHVKGIILLRRGSIPKTSSGKVQRSLLKEKYLEHSLNIIYESIQ